VLGEPPAPPRHARLRNRMRLSLISIQNSSSCWRIVLALFSCARKSLSSH
jgi:hypothetical protein